MSIYEKFNKKIDVAGLKADAKEIAENGGGSYKEVPHGVYEVSIEKMELKETKKGDPMFSVWFTILEGEFTGSKLFYNQVLTTGFGIHNACEFLRSMELDKEISFMDFVQFGTLIDDVFESEIKDTLEFVIEYGQTKKGFDTYSIVEVFEK